MIQEEGQPTLSPSRSLGEKPRQSRGSSRGDGPRPPLRYVSDETPGVTRERNGRIKFRYRLPSGRLVADRMTLRRIRRLAIPPAWTDVWICPSGDGHIQATGRDGRGRKQYRYHDAWRKARDESKYGRVVAFGHALPRIRRRVDRDLRRPSLDRAKVLAAVVRLLETSLIRVGNEEYARQNHSFGLSTLRDRHVRIKGGRLHFDFRGKSGKRHEIDLRDARLAKVLRAAQALPGQILFQYLDEKNDRHHVTAGDVNAYLRQIAGEEFSAKDFRTWAGTVLAAIALHEFKRFDSQAEARSNVVRAIEAVARRLGNTPSICRKCYIHPEVLGAYLRGETIGLLQHKTARALRDVSGLRPEEAVVLAFLERRLKPPVPSPGNRRGRPVRGGKHR